MSEADDGSMAVEVKTLHQYSVYTICCIVFGVTHIHHHLKNIAKISYPFFQH